jgi:hypothetical protein
MPNSTANLLPLIKTEDLAAGLTCLPVMCTDSTLQALDDLKMRFADEDIDNLINHAVQAFWARTCKQLPGGPPGRERSLSKEDTFPGRKSEDGTGGLV